MALFDQSALLTETIKDMIGDRLLKARLEFRRSLPFSCQNTRFDIEMRQLEIAVDVTLHLGDVQCGFTSRAQA